MAQPQHNTNQRVSTLSQLSINELLKRLATYLERRETIFKALQRLKLLAPQKKRLSYSERKKLNQTPPAAVSQDDKSKYTEHIEEITELADLLMSKGKLDIYDETLETIVHHLVSEDDNWDPHQSTQVSDLDQMDEKDEVQWEYRWNDQDNIQGPFKTQMMKDWYQAGFLSSSTISIRTFYGGNRGDWQYLKDHIPWT